MQSIIRFSEFFNLPYLKDSVGCCLSSPSVVFLKNNLRWIFLLKYLLVRQKNAIFQNWRILFAWLDYTWTSICYAFSWLSMLMDFIWLITIFFLFISNICKIEWALICHVQFLDIFFWMIPNILLYVLSWMKPYPPDFFSFFEKERSQLFKSCGVK